MPLPDKEIVNKTLSFISDLIKQEEDNEIIKAYQPEIDEVLKARTIGGYESPEPGARSESDKHLLATVYSKCRADGGDKEKCAKIAWGAVNNKGKSTKSAVMKSLEGVLIKLQKAIEPDNTKKSPEKLQGAIDKIISKFNINTGYDIPFIAGYSKDGKTVYIHRAVPKQIETDGITLDAISLISIHEILEKMLIDYLGIDYLEAHQLAIAIEEAYLKSYGGQWVDYDRVMDKIKQDLDKLPIQSVPSDLDLTPYEREAKAYPEDKKILEDMKKVMKAVTDNNVDKYQAQKEYSCGAAACRIALEMIDIHKTEEEIRGLLKTSSENGTLTRNIPPMLDYLNLSYIVMRNAAVEDLTHYSDMGFVIIVRYYMPQYKADHYTVIQKLDAQGIAFHDPFYGDNTMSLKEFNDLWGGKSELGGEFHWFVGIKNKQYVEGL